MTTSDSEDFESADEGHGSPEKKERKKRLSSSNHSDNALETEQKPLKTQTSSKNDQKLVENVKETDGWDDFDIEDVEPIAPQPGAKSTVPENVKNKPEVKPSVTKQSAKSQDTGWDEFQDWGSGAVNADDLFDDWGTEGAPADVQKNDGWGTQDASADVQKFGTWGTEIADDKLDDWGTDDSCGDEKIVDWGTKLADEKFGDWEPEDVCADEKFDDLPKPREVRPRPITRQPEPNIKEVTDRMAAASAGSGWGWGWTVDSLLSSATAGFSSATAGISNITSQVSQGISTALESGIGAPDPEELARRTSTRDNETRVTKPDNVPAADKITVVASEEVDANAGAKAGANAGADAGDNAGGNAGEAFQFGSLFSGVTKFVETTGTKVIHGGLDTLETIGKKTMEVLQDGDPGLAKKRALLGLGAGDKPVLSQVLREAKAKAEEDDRVREEKREAKEVHYENLFDDFEGLVHLEALEMLSKQVSMRIEERIRSVDADKRQDIKETLQQVAELCEMPEEDEEDEESPSEDLSKSDAFHERLQTATQDLGLKLQFQPLVKQYKEILDYISTLNSEASVKAVYKRGVSTLAQSTALSVEQYHKAAEMLLVKARRSTADEADALTQMTVVLTKHISELATLFTEKLNALPSDNKEQVNTYITNIFLEAGNSSTYIQNAFQLALPILQIGAV